MDWIEISVRADGEAAEAVSELFNRLNSRPDGQGGAVTEVGGFDPVGEAHHPLVTVRTYLPADWPESAERQRQIEMGLWFLGRIHPLGEPMIRTLAEEDWANAWKAHYHPLRIGRRFLVIPAWQTGQVQPAPDDLTIVLDPGMAFGTGLHPSTQLCLRAMEDVIAPGQRVLDAGCGSGILSIAAARLGATAWMLSTSTRWRSRRRSRTLPSTICRWRSRSFVAPDPTAVASGSRRGVNARSGIRSWSTSCPT